MGPAQVSKTHLHLPLGIGLDFAAINRTAIKVWKDPRRTIFRKNGLLEKTTNSLIKSCEFSNQCSRITCFRTPFIHWLRSFAATSNVFSFTSLQPSFGISRNAPPRGGVAWQPESLLRPPVDMLSFLLGSNSTPQAGRAEKFVLFKTTEKSIYTSAFLKRDKCVFMRKAENGTNPKCYIIVDEDCLFVKIYFSKIVFFWHFS